MTQYTTLADASQTTNNPLYGAGTTEVWYYKLDNSLERNTPEFALLGTHKNHGKIVAKLPDPNDLEGPGGPSCTRAA